VAVETPQVEITPYTSTIPLVQMSPEAMAGSGVQPSPPLQGQFTKRSTGALAIGDALVKGILQGHQVKEQRKNAEAQTTIAAADAASEAAFQKYQDAITAANGNQNDPTAQAAYKSYQQIFDQGKQAKAKFVIPEKPQKGDKSQQKKGLKGEVKSGFSSIKDFFEANPHVVPQIALLTMQPKPPGITPQNKLQTLETQREQQVLDEGQQKAANLKTYQDGYATFASLTQEEIANLPPDAKKNYDKWVGAKAALTPMRSGGTMYTYMVNGKPVKLYPEDAYMMGASLYVPGQEPKPGTEGAFTLQALTKYGYQSEGEAPPELMKYIHDWWGWKQAQTTSATSGSTVDVHGNRTTTNNSTRAAQEPKPPSGFAPISAGQRGMQPPPNAPQAASPTGKLAAPPAPPQAGGKTGKGKMEAPPSGQPTLTDANRTQKVETEKSTRYQKAETAYAAALGNNEKAYQLALSRGTDQATAAKQRDAANQQAAEELGKAKDEIGKWYAQQVHAIGGNMPDDVNLPQAALSQLKSGFVTTFANGQQWTLDDKGKPKQVK
jgi:hypothetical protein